MMEDQYDFDEFDFGFTAVDETELEIVKKKLEETTKSGRSHYNHPKQT